MVKPARGSVNKTHDKKLLEKPCLHSNEGILGFIPSFMETLKIPTRSK